MFKTAVTKIAHNSTLPALGGNQDLRPLQDLITAEKAVLISLQKLSVDYSKAADALRTWGLNEGDDLGDILSASTTILNHFSSALSQYAAHGHVIRDHLKSIRTKEEALEELKRRRRTVAKKAEDADKKLSKMGSEHKGLVMQTELLSRLRDEIRVIDSDIMSEEAALGDFKRTASRMWLGLKFGGLLECCEKGTIVAEFGKTIISEIPEDITQPGLPRSLYYGHSKTENIVAEVSRCVNEVSLSIVPTVGFRDRRQYEQSLPAVPQQNLQQTGYPLPNEGYEMSWPPSDNKPQPPPPMQTGDLSIPQRPYASGAPGVPASPATSLGGSFANHPDPHYNRTHASGSGYDSRTMPLPSQSPPTLGTIDSQQHVDDFGMNTRSGPSGLIDNTDGGRFATFPVQNRPPGLTGGYTLQDPPSLTARNDHEISLSASIAEALESATQAESGLATPGRGRVNINPPPPPVFEAAATKVPEGNQSSPSQGWSGLRTNGLRTSPAPAAGGTAQAPSGSIPHSSAHPPPHGAAGPDPFDRLANASREGLMQAPSHTRNISQLSDNDDALLAYMTAAHEESHTDEEADISKSLAGSARDDLNVGRPISDEEKQRISRYVMFGETEGVEEEKRKSLEKERKLPEKVDTKRVSLIENGHNLNQGEGGFASVSGQRPNDGEISPTSEPSKPRQHRVSPPIFNPEAEDEIALNAAAARGITLELDALSVNSTNSSDVNHRGQTEPIVERGRLSTTLRGYDADTRRDPSPLTPPSAPFAKRAVSPHPYTEHNKNSPYGSQPPYSPSGSYGQTYKNPSSPYASPSNTSPAQAYAQSYQSSTDGHGPSSALSSRFQATRIGSGSQLPSRFQNSGLTQIPPTVNPAEQKVTAGTQGAESPYRTPQEYPHSPGASLPFNRSNPSLNTTASPVSSLSASVPGSARTISAAAFKRPRNLSNDNAGDPFAKKSLPSTPYPSRDPSALVGPTLTAAPAEENEEEDYDYISAYVNNSGSNSPHRTSFDASSGQGHGQGVAGRPGGGYGNGRFATNLESGSLR